MSYPTKKLWEVWEIITWNTPPKDNKNFWWWNTLFGPNGKKSVAKLVNKCYYRETY